MLELHILFCLLALVWLWLRPRHDGCVRHITSGYNGQHYSKKREQY